MVRGRYRSKGAGRVASACALLAVLICTRDAQATFTAPVDVASGDVGRVALATNDRGDSTLVWRAGEFPDPYRDQWQLRARTLSAEGVLGPTRALSAQDYATYPSVSTNAIGDSVAVWSWGRNWDFYAFYPDPAEIRAVRIAADGTFHPKILLSADNCYDAGPAKVATNDAGDTAVVWSCLSQVKIATLSASTGHWRPIRTVANIRRGFAGGLLVAIDQEGDALVTWKDEGPDGAFKARIVPAAGKPGPILSVTPSAYGCAGIANDDAGDAVVTWNEQGGDLRARTISTSGVLGPTVVLRGDHDTSCESVSMDDHGNALVTWSEYDPAAQESSIRARAILASGRVTQLRTLSDPPSMPGHEGTFSPTVAAAPGGGGTVAWVHRESVPDDLSNLQIQARAVGARAEPIGPVENLSPLMSEDPIQEVFPDPVIATDATGLSTVAWTQWDDDEDIFRIQAARQGLPVPSSR